MNLKKFYNDHKKTILRGAILLITFFVTVILPLCIYLETLNMNLDPKTDISSYLIRLERSTIQMIIIGIITMILLLISFFLKPNSTVKLSLSILIKLLYMVYIIISSNSEILEIITGNLYLKVDFSALNYFLLGLPILFIIRAIIIFIYDHTEFISTLILLEAISLNQNAPKIKIRKIILKNKELNQKIKRYLLKNLTKFIIELEMAHPYSLIRKSNKGFIITKAGQDFLNYRRYTMYEEEPQLDTLQVWTESELENLARKRVENNK